MSANRFTASSGSVATSTTAKTVLQIKAGSNHAAVIDRLTVTGAAAAGGTDAPATVRFTRSTANFGTFTGTPVSLKDDPGRAETLQIAVASDASAEPTAPTATGHLWLVPPAGSLVRVFNPPLVIPGGAALNVEIDAAAGTPSFTVEVNGEE